MLVVREQYLEWLGAAGYGSTIAPMVQVFGEAKGILTSSTLTILGGIVGFFLGNMILRKHVKKARL